MNYNNIKLTKLTKCKCGSNINFDKEIIEKEYVNFLERFIVCDNCNYENLIVTLS